MSTATQVEQNLERKGAEPGTSDVGKADTGPATIIAGILWVLSVFGGMFLMGRSFAVPGFEFIVFLAGLLITTIGFYAPMAILRRHDGANELT